ncbi:MAG: hypothetical protein IT374_25245 [Polyangiaceae bacterium]|nr:hypothetical protein [Polyangiaceae bacterium]
MAEQRDVSLSLTTDQALVLFEWLVRRSHAGREPEPHPAETAVLWDVEAQLEARLVAPLAPGYEAAVRAARARVLGERE